MEFLKKEAEALAEFEKAERGFFNGFSFVNLFHEKYHKGDAVEILESDDCADVITSAGAVIHAGADDITVYVMSTDAVQNGAKKTVRFNRSIYVF